VTGRTNIAGAGLNLAQRVMDCGDAGHILLSRRVAEDLEQYDHWRPLLHDLGEREVKHGIRVRVVNLYSDEVGNAQLPEKFEVLQKRRVQWRWGAVAAGVLIRHDPRRFCARFQEIGNIDSYHSSEKHRGLAV
jgi:hypothetical protein